MKTTADWQKEIKIPKEVLSCLKTLKNNGFEAFLVGGCVRDLILNRKPKDWDITTNAKPEQIISIFPKTVYENKFGTVAVVNEQPEDGTAEIVEITPYRLESDYSDHRHPNEVRFGESIKDDLARRDFTINALGMDVDVEKGDIKDIVDLYDGIKDIKDKTIRTVLNPDERFKEDALRMLRAIRLAAELGFTINNETSNSIQSNANTIDKVSKERIRDEFSRIIMSKEPMIGIVMLQKYGLLKHFIPELEKGMGVEQNQAHSYDVWEHLLRTLQHSADKDYPFEVRLSAIFHDISKPETRRFSHETKQYTFYGHEVVGSRVTRKILERLKYPSKTIDKVVKLVRWHMFFSDTESITLSAVRRMINNVGRENIWDLMNLRICDRIGTGRPKESPYRLRKYHSMIEEALRDPISVQMLKIDGNKVIGVTHVTPGPEIGHILHALLEEVIENPSLNTEEYLEKRAMELSKIDKKDLKKLGESGKQAKNEEDEAVIREIRGKFHVK